MNISIKGYPMKQCEYKQCLSINACDMCSCVYHTVADMCSCVYHTVADMCSCVYHTVADMCSCVYHTLTALYGSVELPDNGCISGLTESKQLFWIPGVYINPAHFTPDLFS